MPLLALYQRLKPYIPGVATRDGAFAWRVPRLVDEGDQIAAAATLPRLRKRTRPRPAGQVPLRPFRAPLRGVASQRSREARGRAPLRGPARAQSTGLRLLSLAYGRDQGTPTAGRARALGPRLGAPLRND